MGLAQQWIRFKNALTLKTRLGRRNVKDSKEAIQIYSQIHRDYETFLAEVSKPLESIDVDIVATLSQSISTNVADLVDILTDIQTRIYQLEVHLVSLLENVAKAFDKISNRIPPQRAIQLLSHANTYKDRTIQFSNYIRSGRMMSRDIFQGRSSIRELSPRMDIQLLNTLLRNSRRERWSIRPLRKSTGAVCKEINLVPYVLARELRRPGNFQDQLTRIDRAIADSEQPILAQLMAFRKQMQSLIMMLYRIMHLSRSVGSSLASLQRAGLPSTTLSSYNQALISVQGVIQHEEHMMVQHSQIILSMCSKIVSTLERDYSIASKGAQAGRYREERGRKAA